MWQIFFGMDDMRLDKLISHSTALSRAQAKRAIGKGEVMVDAVVVKNSAMQVSDSSEVIFEGRSLSARGPRYIMLNKPFDMVCTSIDDDPRSVLGLIDVERCDELHIAGRLDVDTTGLVLITDDGEWSHRLTSPKKECGKRYRAVLAEPITDEVIAVFANGVMLNGEDKATLPAELEILSATEVILTLHEGKYHQVKRMFGAVHNRVIELHREQVGAITLDADLAPGEWRHLTAEEIALPD